MLTSIQNIYKEKGNKTAVEWISIKKRSKSQKLLLNGTKEDFIITIEINGNYVDTRNLELRENILI